MFYYTYELKFSVLELHKELSLVFHCVFHCTYTVKNLGVTGYQNWWQKFDTKSGVLEHLCCNETPQGFSYTNFGVLLLQDVLQCIKCQKN